MKLVEMFRRFFFIFFSIFFFFTNIEKLSKYTCDGAVLTNKNLFKKRAT